MHAITMRTLTIFPLLLLLLATGTASAKKQCVTGKTIDRDSVYQWKNHCERDVVIFYCLVKSEHTPHTSCKRPPQYYSVIRPIQSGNGYNDYLGSSLRNHGIEWVGCPIDSATKLAAEMENILNQLNQQLRAKVSPREQLEAGWEKFNDDVSRRFFNIDSDGKAHASRSLRKTEARASVKSGVWLAESGGIPSCLPLYR